LIYTIAYTEVLEACSRNSAGFNWRTYADDAPLATNWYKIELQNLTKEPIQQNLILGTVETPAKYFADRTLIGRRAFKQCFIVESEIDALSLSELLELTQLNRDEFIVFALGKDNQIEVLTDILENIICETMYLCELKSDDSQEYSTTQNLMDKNQVCWSSFNCFDQFSTILSDSADDITFSSILRFVQSKEKTDISRFEVLEEMKSKLRITYENALLPKKVMFKFWRTINKKLESTKHTIVLPKNDLDKKTFDMVKEEVFQTINKIGKLTFVEDSRNYSFILNNKSEESRRFWDKTFQNLRFEFEDSCKSWFTDNDNFVDNSDAEKAQLPVIMNVIKSPDKMDADNEFTKIARFLGIVKDDVMKNFLRELKANSYIKISKIKRLNKNFAMTEINSEKVLVVGNENEEGLMITNEEIKQFINGENGLFFKQKYPHILNYQPNLEIPGNPVGEKMQDLNFPNEVRWLYEALAYVSPFIVSYEEGLQRNIVSVIGASGTGKSTATQMFLKMIGRVDAKLHVASGSREGMIETIVSSNDIVGVDEFETISSDNQSILRTLVTGGESTKRKLYTSNEMISISFNGLMFIHAEQSSNWLAQGLVRRMLICKPSGIIKSDKNIERIPSDVLERIHTDLVRKWQNILKYLNENTELPELPLVKNRFKRFWQLLLLGLQQAYDDADEKIEAMDNYFQSNQREFMQEQDYFANGICDAFEITEGEALEYDKSYSTGAIRNCLKEVLPSAKFNNRPFNSNTSLSKALEDRSYNCAVNDSLPSVFEEITGIRIEQIKHRNRNMYKFIKIEVENESDDTENSHKIEKCDENTKMRNGSKVINLSSKWKRSAIST